MNAATGRSVELHAERQRAIRGAPAPGAAAHDPAALREGLAMAAMQADALAARPSAEAARTLARQLAGLEREARRLVLVLQQEGAGDG